MLLDPDFGVHASRPDGPQSLYRAVVARAVLDLFGKVVPAPEGVDSTGARREALFFLVRESGAWAESRRSLCDACGIDPDALRANTLSVLAGREIIGSDHRHNFEGIELARRLWAEEQAAPIRAQEQRKRQKSAPRKPAPASYSTIRSAILPLLFEPRQFKDLIIATDGEYGDSMIRKVLANAIQKGEVERDDENHTYVLAVAA